MLEILERRRSERIAIANAQLADPKTPPDLIDLPTALELLELPHTLDNVRWVKAKLPATTAARINRANVLLFQREAAEALARTMAQAKQAIPPA